jgi:hypothetical protein
MAAARKALPKERGIYVRETRDGTRYEFIYQDSTGRTRWQTCSTLKEARQGRAAKVAALARGERHPRRVRRDLDRDAGGQAAAEDAPHLPRPPAPARCAATRQAEARLDQRR